MRARIVAGALFVVLGSLGCNGRVVTSAEPSPVSEAGVDAVVPEQDAGHDSGPSTGVDSSVEPDCDISNIAGEVNCCAGKVCRGYCTFDNECWCGEEVLDPGCPEGTVCCEESPGSPRGYCTSEAVCNGTFDPDAEKLVDGGPDGSWLSHPVTVRSVCNGKPCRGRCVLDPQGHEHCSCWGIDGGCPGDLNCCAAPPEP